MASDTDKILGWLYQASELLGNMLDGGITDELIDELNAVFQKLRRRLRRLLRRYVGKPQQQWRKWVALAKLIVDSVISWVLFRSL